MDIIDAYRFVEDYKENFLTIGRKNITFCKAEMVGIAKNSIKYVTVLKN